MQQKYPITLAGFKKLEEELANLKHKERPKITEEISEAREHGDLKENAEYHAAREKQSFLEGKIALYETYVTKAEVVDVGKLSGSKVVFGATITIYDEEEDKEKQYKIVGEYEADIDKNLLAFDSPISRALIGKEEGDEVQVKMPKTTKIYEIVKVEFI